MRILKYDKPFKIRRSIFNREYAKRHDNGNYESGCSIMTKEGIVIITSMKWETNFGWDEFTRFETVIDGYVHSAFLEQGELHSERAMKWMASNFIKTVLKRIKEGLQDNVEEEHF